MYLLASVRLFCICELVDHGRKMMSNNTDKGETYPKRKGEARARKVWWIDNGHDKGKSVQHKLKYVALSEKRRS